MMSTSEVSRWLAEHEQDEAARRAAEAEEKASLAERRVQAMRAERMTAEEEADQALADLASEYPELLDGPLAPCDFE